MSAPPVLDFEMKQGDTKRLRITVKDPDNNVISLVAAQSIRWWVARKVTSTVRLLEKDADQDGGIIVTDAAGGLLTITLDPEDTAAVSGEYYHELEVIDSAGDIGTVLTGTITILRALVANPTTP